MTVKRPTVFALPLIGWKEEISLPLLGASMVVAKIDTGAKIAALHAEDITVLGKHVHFTLAAGGRRRKCSAALADLKRIKSSNGLSELRPVIETMIQVGEHVFKSLVTLTDRADMGVPMLLGRLSIKGRFLVHPGRSFILSRKKRQS
jgi:hypothetical protein